MYFLSLFHRVYYACSTLRANHTAETSAAALERSSLTRAAFALT